VDIFLILASVRLVWYKKGLALLQFHRPRTIDPDLALGWPHYKMATQTESFTKAWTSVGRIRASVTSPPDEATAAPPSLYHIEEQPPVKTPVPFNSPLSIAAHLMKWATWALYLALRLSGIYGSSSHRLWIIYLCEVAFGIQDFQTALDLSLSLFGPCRSFEHAQYSLKGTRAPKVHVLVTSGSPFFSYPHTGLTTSGFAEKIYQQSWIR